MTIHVFLSGRRREELSIIKLGQKAVEKASISDDKEVERCLRPRPPPSLENKKDISDDNAVKRFFPSSLPHLPLTKHMAAIGMR
jgi:hypothetical protein